MPAHQEKSFKPLPLDEELKALTASDMERNRSSLGIALEVIQWKVISSKHIYI